MAPRDAGAALRDVIASAATPGLMTAVLPCRCTSAPRLRAMTSRTRSADLAVERHRQVTRRERRIDLRGRCRTSDAARRARLPLALRGTRGGRASMRCRARRRPRARRACVHRAERAGVAWLQHDAGVRRLSVGASETDPDVTATRTPAFAGRANGERRAEIADRGAAGAHDERTRGVVLHVEIRFAS